MNGAVHSVSGRMSEGAVEKTGAAERTAAAFRAFPAVCDTVLQDQPVDLAQCIHVPSKPGLEELSQFGIRHRTGSEPLHETAGVVVDDEVRGLKGVMVILLRSLLSFPPVG